MQAMQLFSPGDVSSNPLHYVGCNTPETGPGEILLKVTCCGVCHTDLHIVEGELLAPRYPVIPGHQIIGTVVDIGPGVPKDLLGTRMGMPWVYKTCGKCQACLRGDENLCSSIKFTGLDSDGGFAEYFVAPVDFAFLIPETIESQSAALLMCAGIIGYRSLRCANLQPGENLGLIGFGASAHLAIQVAHHWGCRVWVFTRSDMHRQNARNLGAHWVGGIEVEMPAVLDRAILFAPVGALVPLALKKIRPGGTLAINAVYMSNLPEFEYSLLYGERALRSVANATRRDAVEFLNFAAQAGIRPEVKVYPLDAANQALQDLKYSRLTGGAVLEISA